MVAGRQHYAIAEATVLPLIDDFEAWRRHPRLQRHLKMYLQSNAAEVLMRYRRRAGSLASCPLSRHLCHVGAWVALLPADIVASAVPGTGIEELSPVRLLGLLLPLGSRSRIKPWLRGILRLVAARLQEALACPEQATEHWCELKQSIPRSISKSLFSSHPAASSTSTAKLHTGKRKCQAISWDSNFQNDIQGPDVRFRRTLGSVREQQQHVLVHIAVLTGADRDAKIQEVLSGGMRALSLVDADEMVQLVVAAVGLLSAPHQAATVPSEGSMSEPAKVHLRSAKQAQLRLLLLRLLGGSRTCGGLDLTDTGTSRLLQLPLQHLRLLLDGADLSQVASADQWQGLAAIFGLEDAHLRVARPSSFPYMLTDCDSHGARNSEAGSATSEKLPIVETGDQSKPLKDKEAGWSAMVREAVTYSGGSVTVECVLDFALSEKGDFLLQRPHWKKRLQETMYTVLQQQGRNAEGEVVWCLDPDVQGGFPKHIRHGKYGYRTERRAPACKGQVQFKILGPHRATLVEALADRDSHFEEWISILRKPEGAQQLRAIGCSLTTRDYLRERLRSRQLKGRADEISRRAHKRTTPVLMNRNIVLQGLGL